MFFNLTLRKIHYSKYVYIQGEAHKVVQSDGTQTIDHIQKCFRQKFQCSRRLHQGQLHFLKWNHVFFSITLLPILRRIQRPTTPSDDP